jgi:hypothetical protein
MELQFVHLFLNLARSRTKNNMCEDVRTYSIFLGNIYIQCIHCMKHKYLTADTLHGSSTSKMYECVFIDLLTLS